MNGIKWSDVYSINIEKIDNEHKELFSIINKILSLLDDEDKGERVTKQGIQFFKNYTKEHFAHEEEYMLSINYPDYEVHKKIHDTLKDKTLPVLEQKLIDSSFSKEAIQEFVGICVGWLTGHIMLTDKAIGDEKISKELMSGSLIDAFIANMKQVFKMDVSFEGDIYDTILAEKGLKIAFTYKNATNDTKIVLVALDNNFSQIADNSAYDNNTSNTVTTYALYELIEMLTHNIENKLFKDNSYEYVGSSVVENDLLKDVLNRYPLKSTYVFDTPKGKYGIMIS